MPGVQQKNLKDTVAIATCPRNSHKGISASKRSEKNLQAAIQRLVQRPNPIKRQYSEKVGDG
ncbi:hypothetical protein C3Y91_37915 [Rhizobium sp. UPM1133]|nr:hypothetical protein [Rhizobium ruizarguesonis]TBC68741.1 hypothetical protein ELH30_31705 [Rhizobium ruizarguesonis]